MLIKSQVLSQTQSLRHAALPLRASVSPPVNGMRQLHKPYKVSLKINFNETKGKPENYTNVHSGYSSGQRGPPCSDGRLGQGLIGRSMAQNPGHWLSKTKLQ